MKISTWHKTKRNSIAFIHSANFDLTDPPDKIYGSIIYKKNKRALNDLISRYPGIDIDIGGSGYDLNKTLPDEVEKMRPDYSLYPDCDYSVGFSSRGCIRKCYFCIVHEKEGGFHRTQHPQQWYNPAYNKIAFLDNNILADKEWFIVVTNWCLDKKLKMGFLQGLDIRRVDLEIAKRLYEIKNHHTLSFAWDNIEMKLLFVRKLHYYRKQASQRTCFELAFSFTCMCTLIKSTKVAPTGVVS
jgi:hypothetical protein